jgi:hypothetical protein
MFEFLLRRGELREVPYSQALLLFYLYSFGGDATAAIGDLAETIFDDSPQYEVPALGNFEGFLERPFGGNIIEPSEVHIIYPIGVGAVAARHYDPLANHVISRFSDHDLHPFVAGR